MPGSSTAGSEVTCKARSSRARAAGSVAGTGWLREAVTICPAPYVPGRGPNSAVSRSSCAAGAVRNAMVTPTGVPAASWAPTRTV